MELQGARNPDYRSPYGPRRCLSDPGRERHISPGPYEYTRPSLSLGFPPSIERADTPAGEPLRQLSLSPTGHSGRRLRSCLPGGASTVRSHKRDGLEINRRRPRSRLGKGEELVTLMGQARRAWHGTPGQRLPKRGLGPVSPHNTCLAAHTKGSHRSVLQMHTKWYLSWLVGNCLPEVSA